MYAVQTLATDFYRICGDRQIDYWITKIKKKMYDAVDLLCSSFNRTLKDNKCLKLQRDHPLVVPAKKRRQSESVLLVIVDILSQLAAAPDI